MTKNKEIMDFTLEETSTETTHVETEDVSASPIEGEEPEAAEDEEEINYAENPFFEKLAKFPPKKAKRFQIIYGLICGMVCYAALLLEEFFPQIDQLLKYACWGVLVVILFLSFSMGKKTKWDMIPYRLGLAIGVLVGIVAHIIYMYATGDPLFG